MITVAMRVSVSQWWVSCGVFSFRLRLTTLYCGAVGLTLFFLRRHAAYCFAAALAAPHCELSCVLLLIWLPALDCVLKHADFSAQNAHARRHTLWQPRPVHCHNGRGAPEWERRGLLIQEARVRSWAAVFFAVLCFACAMAPMFYFV